MDNVLPKFSAVLPVRGTDEEMGYIEASLSSIIRVGADEILIVTDDPHDKKIDDACSRVIKQFNAEDRVRIVQIKKDPEWRMPLAKIIWETYKIAKHDIIYSFDIDTIVRDEILLGLEQIGKNNVVAVSFTKKMRLKTFGDHVRYFTYRQRIKHTDFVFSGNYFIYRPYYFDMMDINKVRSITNGIDGLLVKTIEEQDKYKLITRKEHGTNMLNLGNEEYDWRQFQEAVWIFAHYDKLRKQRLGDTRYKKLSRALLRAPFLYVLLKTFSLWRWTLLYGYLWALTHQKHPIIDEAKKHDAYEWAFMGSKYVRQVFKSKMEDTTGFE